MPVPDALVAKMGLCDVQGDAGYQDVLECADAIAKVRNLGVECWLDHVCLKLISLIIMHFFFVFAATQNKAT